MKGLWELDLRTSSSVYAKARTAIWPWADPDVAAVSEGCDIDLDWLLRVTNTLYLATPLAHQDRLAPVLGGLIADLVNQAFERVSRLRQRLDPTLLLVVDEAANTPLRKLPEWASTVAGIGIQLVTVAVQEPVGGHLRRAGGHDPHEPPHQAVLQGHVRRRRPEVRRTPHWRRARARLPRLGQARCRRAGDPDAGRSPRTQLVRQMRPGDALLVHGTLPPAHVRPSKA